MAEEPSWNEKTTEDKNDFFLQVAKRNEIKIEQPGSRALKKTKSQSQLTQSTASLIGVSETDLSLLTAQLGAGGRLKRQSSIRNVFNVDSLLEEEENNSTELPSFSTSSLSFVKEEDGRVKLKKASKNALLNLLVDPTGHDVDFETTFFFTFTLFMSIDDLLTFFAEWLEVSLEARLENRKSCQKSRAVKKKAKHLLTYWVRLVPEDFLGGEEQKNRLTKINSLLAALDTTPVTPIPNFAIDFLGEEGGGTLNSGGSLSGGGSAPDVSVLMAGTGLSSPRKLEGSSLSSPRSASVENNDNSSLGAYKPKKRRTTLTLKRRGTRKGTWSSGSENNSTLFRWSPLKIAQNLTHLAWRYFERVGSREWLSGAWGGDAMEEESVPGVFNLVVDFNFTHGWVANEIVQCSDLGERTAILELMIEVLGECVTQRNYHTGMSMLSALLSTPVDRLEKTWKGISSKSKKSFQASKELLSIDNNFATLRTATYSASLPLLPYVGLSMGDITGIRQTNIVSGDEGEEVVLFEQLDVMARVIAHVRHCQTNPYNYRGVNDFVNLLGKNVLLDRNGLYERSKEIEKGETKEEDSSMSRAERRKSFVLPFSPVSPAGTTKKDKPKDSLGGISTPDHSSSSSSPITTLLHPSNPYSNRFTPSQLDVMIEFLEKNPERRPEGNSEEFEELRKSVGKTGQGGLLLSKNVILLWLKIQFDQTKEGAPLSPERN